MQNFCGEDYYGRLAIITTFLIIQTQPTYRCGPFMKPKHTTSKCRDQTLRPRH